MDLVSAHCDTFAHFYNDNSLQLEIYRNDFESERKSRQDMASEREEILSDLKLLQRRNEELMMAAQMR